MQALYLNPLSQTLAYLKSCDIKVRTMYSILRLDQKVQSELALYNEAVSTLIRTYGEFDENGQLQYTDTGDIKIRPDAIQECNEEFAKLMSTEVELPQVQFKLEELENLNLSCEQLQTLMLFIVE